jgi:hypothetical protein
MRAAVCAIVTALLAFHHVPEARAETPSRPGSRLYQGFSFGNFGVSSSLSIGDHRHDEESGFNVAVNVGYLQGLRRYLGLGLFAGIGSGDTYWSEQRGESRTRAHIALGPIFVGPFYARRPNIEWRIGLPLGYTRAWINPGQNREVEESFSAAHGMNLSVVAGVDIVGKHHGGFIDVAYAVHLTWLTHTATLKSDRSVQSKESYRYLDQALLLGVGYVYRF